ncbi:MAG: ATP-binding protein [Methanomassiliicoccales archaeon]|nr:ATP-binding protein [Methanomassiliicoccales archaeon]
MTLRRPDYPFSAIVGQEEMKEALILNTIDTSIGGVLIRGEKGTAKSTAVRGLAEVLPNRKTVVGCRFHCDWTHPDKLCPECLARVDEGEELQYESIPMKVVELPLSATEDRVAGTLDIEHALTTGKKKFEPGILAEANGNLLYVDEVNLLDDHLVDLLLDSAALGVNYVEREGISFMHPARFALVGTMNPEEGDLRPQLLDRFGLAVDVKGETDPELRVQVIKNRMDYELDPETFRASFEQQQEELSQRITRAQNLVHRVKVGEEVLSVAVELALHLKVDGHRADINLIKAAKAWAAYEGREEVRAEDIIHVAKLVLPHRMRRLPFEEARLDMTELEVWLRDRLAQ